MPDVSLINLGELAKPATVLIEKISDAIGALYKPRQIVRCAQAEAEAEKIKAIAQIEISDLERRALQRFVAEETKKQSNVEEITRQAIPLLGQNANPENMENDWIVNFFDKSKLISDQEMQRLWSNLLAGEANAPGTYSKRTVNILSDLDKKDAELFTVLCGFGWNLGMIVPLIFDVQEKIYSDYGINFDVISHLDSLGLVRFDNLAGFRAMSLPNRISVAYYWRCLELMLPKEIDNEIDLGKVLFTKAGSDLAHICESKPVDGYFEYVYDRWSNLGYIPKREI